MYEDSSSQHRKAPQPFAHFNITRPDPSKNPPHASHVLLVSLLVPPTEIADQKTDGTKNREFHFICSFLFQKTKRKGNSSLFLRLSASGSNKEGYLKIERENSEELTSVTISRKRKSSSKPILVVPARVSFPL